MRTNVLLGAIITIRWLMTVLCSKCVAIFSPAVVFGEFDVATQTRWVRVNTEACANVAWPPKMPTLVALFRHGRQLPSELPPKEEVIVPSTRSVRPDMLNHVTTPSSRVTDTGLQIVHCRPEQDESPNSRLKHQTAIALDTSSLSPKW